MTAPFHAPGARRRRVGIAGIATLLVSFSISPNAHADAPVSAADSAQAQHFFDEARTLMNNRDYARACAKFAASQGLDPAAGTLLNLANCYDKSGRTATAWETFKDAAAAAHEAHRSEWEALATKRIGELEPKLSRLTIRLADPAASVTVTRDDRPLSRDQLGTAVAVDPGTHRVDASSDGKTTSHIVVTIGANGDAREVVIPALRDGHDTREAHGDVAADRSTSDTSGGSSSSPLPAIGVGLLAAGGAGIVIGAVTGVLAIGKNSTAKSSCPNAGACSDPSAVDASSSAQSLGHISTIGFVAGGVLAAGGLVLLFAAPGASHDDVAFRLAPEVNRNQAGLGLSGTF